MKNNPATGFLRIVALTDATIINNTAFLSYNNVGFYTKSTKATQELLFLFMLNKEVQKDLIWKADLNVDINYLQKDVYHKMLNKIIKEMTANKIIKPQNDIGKNIHYFFFFL